MKRTNPAVYALDVQPESLRIQPRPEGSAEDGEIVYCLDLTDSSDSAWRRWLCRIQWDSLDYFNYKLADDGKTISFALSGSEYPEEVSYMVSRLRLLIEEVNRRASIRVPEPRPSWGEMELACEDSESRGIASA